MNKINKCINISSKTYSVLSNMNQPSVVRANEVYGQQNIPGIHGSRPVTVIDGLAYPHGYIANPNHSNFGGSRVIGGSRVNGSFVNNRVINGLPVGSNVFTNAQSIINHPSAIRK